MIKTRIIYTLLLLVLFLVNCEKREAEEVVIPGWMEARLLELENSGECSGCILQRWTYSNEYYYHLYCNYWSCSSCEVYRYNGEKVVWGENVDPGDYEANKHRPVKLWECGDSINPGS